MKKSAILVTIVAMCMLIGMVLFIPIENKIQDNKQSGKLDIVVTNSIIFDITKNIGGEKINIHSIVPTGRDPHDYEPLADDVKKTEEADLIFYNGINLENGGNAWFNKLLKNANKKENSDAFAVSDGIDIIYLNGDKVAGKEDPHAWLSLYNGIIYAKNIEKNLVVKDPKNKAYYKKKLDKYVSKLNALNEEATKKFKDIPKDKKVIVTSEGCFKYFSKAYDIPNLYIWEINSGEEGTPEQIKKLVTTLRNSTIPSLFIESSVDKRPMETISKDTGIPIYSKVFTDSVAKKGDDGDTYYSMMKWNLNKIYEGLSLK